MFCMLLLYFRHSCESGAQPGSLCSALSFLLIFEIRSKSVVSPDPAVSDVPALLNTLTGLDLRLSADALSLSRSLAASHKEDISS